MISYEESQNILKREAKFFTHKPPDLIPIEDCVGRILAYDVISREHNPPFDNSAMDGFAVRLEKVNESLNQWLEVNTIVAAGDTAPQECTYPVVEIMTGAPLPPSGYDAVIKVEETETRINGWGRKEIKLNRLPEKNENIRRAGEDTKAGELLLDSGTTLNTQHLLILATQGITHVQVLKKLKVGIISTGKELVHFETQELLPGQIRNSTSIFLNQELKSKLTEVVANTLIEDNAELYVKNLKFILKDDVDIIVSTGAVSMGVYDFVKPALEKMGAVIHFHKCAIRPGKPILFASINFEGRTRYIFGIPGNPVSTVVGYTFFIKPFIQSILGLKSHPPLKAQLKKDVTKPEGLRCFFKANLEESNNISYVRSLGGQASFMVSPFSKSNAWVVLPEDGQIIKENSVVEVFKL